MSTNLTSSAKAAGNDILYTDPNQLRTDIIKNAGDYEDSGGAGNAYTLAIDASYVAYADGDKVRFMPNFSNTDAATLDVNSIGAKAIVKPSNAALGPNDVTSGCYCEVIYDATLDKFVLITARPLPTAQGGTGTVAPNSGIDSSGDIDIAVAPFTANDVLEVNYVIEIYQNTSDNPGNVKYCQTFYHMTGLLGGAQSGFSVTSGTQVAITSPFSGTPTHLGADSPANLTASIAGTPKASQTITISPPVMNGTNLRFHWVSDVTITSPGYAISNIYIGASVTKIG